MPPEDPAEGFIPPPYPHDRLDALRRLAELVPGGIVDCSIGNPVDPVPRAAQRALADAAARATSYPPSIGTPAFRAAAAAWIERRFVISADPDAVIACVGTKELVASLPRLLQLRDPSRDTVLYPAVSYPTYEMGAQLAGCRGVAVPLDAEWHLDLARVDEADARRALVLWVNTPGNPTAAVETQERLLEIVDWARARGITVASDECYAEFSGGDGPATVLAAGAEGVLAVHSLSKRSNMAGYRVGFAAGDPALVRYLGDVRKHAGLIVSTPVQAAAVAALSDDASVDEQRDRYDARRTLVLDGLGPHGLVHDGGPAPFYLWLRTPDGADDGWEIAARLAETGTLVAPGNLYGAAGADHVRLALTQPTERLELVLQRLNDAVTPA